MKGIFKENLKSSNEFFKTTNEICNQIINVLKTAKTELDKICNTHQRISDLRAGLVYKGGLYIPLNPSNL